MKTIKKLISGILTASLLSTSLAFPTLADNDISVVLNGKPIEFDVPPQIINDRTMVPMRAIFEALGASVDWNSETRTVTSTKGNTIVIFLVSLKYCAVVFSSYNGVVFQQYNGANNIQITFLLEQASHKIHKYYCYSLKQDSHALQAH